MVQLQKAKAPLIVTLDVGSSSVRASVYDGCARRVCNTGSRVKHNLITTRDGGVEADPQRLVACVVEALDLTLAQARSREESVAAVAVSVLAASLVGRRRGLESRVRQLRSL